jgi:hypothetical protein
MSVDLPKMVALKNEMVHSMRNGQEEKVRSRS